MLQPGGAPEPGVDLGGEPWEASEQSSAASSTVVGSSASAVMARGRQRRERDRTVAIFWDIENLQIPAGMDAASLAVALQDLGRGLSPTEDLAFCNAYIDTSRLGTLNANRLSQTGVSLIHSPTAKEAADKAIIVDLLLWILMFERSNMYMTAQGFAAPEPCVVLITQDHDFEPMLYKLRNQRGIHVVLVTDFAHVQPHFLNAADEAFDWKEVLGEVGSLETRFSHSSSPRSSGRSLTTEDRVQIAASSPRHHARGGPPHADASPGSAAGTPRGSNGGDHGVNVSNTWAKPLAKESGEAGAESGGKKAKERPSEENSVNESNKEGAGSKTKGLRKKRFSSVRAAASHASNTLEDEIADFTLKAIQAKAGGRHKKSGDADKSNNIKPRLTADVVLTLMKNPATGGAADMYHIASQDYGKRLEAVLTKYPDRFALSYNKRSQKTWVTLVGESHKFLCPSSAQEADAHAQTSSNATTLAPKSPQETAHAGEGAESIPRLRRSPSNWDVFIGRTGSSSTDSDGEST